MVVLLSAIVSFLWTPRKTKTTRWQKLAEITNSTGQYFVVGQKCQLLEGAGWKVAFWFFDTDKKLYSSLLELETIMPWQHVRLIQTNQVVEIWRGERLAGTLDLPERVFENRMNGAIDIYVEGFNGVQGVRITNFVFDVD